MRCRNLAGYDAPVCGVNPSAAFSGSLSIVRQSAVSFTRGVRVPTRTFCVIRADARAAWRRAGGSRRSGRSVRFSPRGDQPPTFLIVRLDSALELSGPTTFRGAAVRPYLE